MNDKEFAEQLASTLQTEQSQEHGFKAGPFSGRLVDALLKLRSLGIKWSKILPLVLTIMDKLNNAVSTVTWEQILQQIIDLFKSDVAPVVQLP